MCTIGNYFSLVSHSVVCPSAIYSGTMRTITRNIKNAALAENVLSAATAPAVVGRSLVLSEIRNATVLRGAFLE